MKKIFFTLAFFTLINSAFAQSMNSEVEESGPIEENVAGVTLPVSSSAIQEQVQDIKTKHIIITDSIAESREPIEEEVYGRPQDTNDYYNNGSGNRSGIYPTVTSQDLFVKSNKESALLITIVDVQGRVVMQLNQPEFTTSPIDISHLNVGIYFVKAENEFYIIKNTIYKN
jgi:galactitol-specific phosphotransferase system IIB component